MAECKSKRGLVTAGASFIGSYLLDALASLGAAGRVADDSAGRREL